MDRPARTAGALGRRLLPLGHTATAAVAYLGAALLVRPYTRRAWPTAVALVLTGATAVGLILRGWHWPLDVLASLLLCTPLLLAVAWADRVGRIRGADPVQPGQPPK